jgi:hypothetical protein
VRTAIRRQLAGDPMNQSWAVMDVLAVTDFPDIRLESAIHCANQRNLLIISREDGYLVRLYIELDGVHDRELLADRDGITPEKPTVVANRTRLRSSSQIDTPASLSLINGSVKGAPQEPGPESSSSRAIDSGRAVEGRWNSR